MDLLQHQLGGKIGPFRAQCDPFAVYVVVALPARGESDRPYLQRSLNQQLEEAISIIHVQIPLILNA